MDRHISAGLALELGLIDAISSESAPETGEARTGHVRIPEWAPLFDPDGRVSRPTLCRHTLALGETGSGKTVSGILPVIGSIMAAENRMVGCTLVIDPKHEIRQSIGQLAHPGIAVHDIDVECARLAQTVLALTLLILSNRRRIFGDNEEPGLIQGASPGTRALLTGFGREAGLLNENRDIVALVRRARESLREIRDVWGEAKEQQDREDQAAEEAKSHRRWDRSRDRDEVATLPQGRFLVQDCLLVPDALAAAMKAEAKQEQDTAGEQSSTSAAVLFDQWKAAATSILENFAEAVRDTSLYRTSKRFREACDQEFKTSAGHMVYERLLDEALPTIEQAALHPLKDESIRPAPNIMALAHTVLQSYFKASRRDSDKKKGTAGRSSTDDMPVMSLIGILRDSLHGGQAEAVYQLIEHTWNPMARAEYQGQYVGVYGYARTCFTDFADKTPAWTLYFGCEPYYRSVMAHGRADFLPIDFSRDVDETDPARRCVYVFQPRLDQNEAIVAKALKAAFFEAVLANRRRRQDGQSMPLVGYVADEFHRFITSDRNHGEQSFLDTCRSFGAFCVLACQSIASMEHALAGTDNNETLNRAAVSILLNNTGNKLFFRSTDRALFERVDQLCPGGGALGKVTHVRPLSTLQPGECYASLSDGRFERRQLLPFGAGQDEDTGNGTARVLQTM